jgi:hypothetical protein
LATPGDSRNIATAVIHLQSGEEALATLTMILQTIPMIYVHQARTRLLKNEAIIGFKVGVSLSVF